MLDAVLRRAYWRFDRPEGAALTEGTGFPAMSSPRATAAVAAALLL